MIVFLVNDITNIGKFYNQYHFYKNLTLKNVVNSETSFRT